MPAYPTKPRLLAAWYVASQDEPATFFMPPWLLKTGYQKALEAHCAKGVTIGAEAIFLHEPFGRVGAGKRYKGVFDPLTTYQVGDIVRQKGQLGWEYAQATRKSFKAVLSDAAFWNWIKPEQMTFVIENPERDPYEKSLSDVKPSKLALPMNKSIGYLGAFPPPPAVGAKELAQYNARLLRGSRAVLSLGMGLAVDSSSDLEENHPGFRFMRGLRTGGCLVYTESAQARSKPHLNQFGCIITTEFLGQVLGNQGPTGWAAKLEDIKGEKVVAFTNPPKDVPNARFDNLKEWLPAWAKTIRDMGFSLAIAPQAVIEQGIAAKDLWP